MSQETWDFAYDWVDKKRGFPHDEMDWIDIIDVLLSTIRKAEQLASIATDWNLSEVEIDGEMVSTYDLLREFKDTLALVKGEADD